MPTGYTYGIEEGTITTLPEFALTCARAFGALVMMRDEPADAPVPDEFTPHDYNAKALDRARTALADAEAMTLEEAQVRADAEYAGAVVEWQKSKDEQATKNRRYADMTEKVKAWTPPTPDHEGLKAFMLEQIGVSVSTYKYPEPERQTGEAWRVNQIESARRDIAYHLKGDREERERAASRTKWVRDLRESLA